MKKTGFVMPGLNSVRIGSRNQSTGAKTAPAAMKPAMTATSVSEKIGAPGVKYLADYTPPRYLVNKIDLKFELDDPETTVTSKIELVRNPRSEDAAKDIILDGDKGLKLVEGSVKLNGIVLSTSDYAVSDDSLTILESAGLSQKEPLELECTVKIRPAENTALEGLYKSGGNYCTQCEAEGFRRIVFYPDRPDVMATYTTTIVADKSQYPVLLSNGNKVEEGDLEGGKHFAKYLDPHKKPCYLFALVAGDLVCNHDTFTTVSGRTVDLNIFVRDGDLPKTGHAMTALKSSMAWDEKVYGREYDLDIFNIVAVDDFNMGAMENKSLNVFNSRYVLVSPETATDGDYSAVEAVIAHEYFHNWTGNRVTCRDWFQLSLKEGLTVFRDQSFSEDMNGKGQERIQQVNRLRVAQFAEDAGPMAHPIRPDSYIEINNFYTQTVYQKGAEVIRMLHTILGPERFRKGTDLYFERHDGQAVTCEDWVQALQDANPEVDLTTFRSWYKQAGTPEITVSREYLEDQSAIKLKVTQTTPSTPGQPTKAPVHIPIKIGLYGPSGEAQPVDTGDGNPAASKVLNLVEAEQEFSLENVPSSSVVSLLQDFSAPVKLRIEGGQSTEELAFLMANEKNDFARWEASYNLGLETIRSLMNDSVDGFKPLPDAVIEAFRAVLKDTSSDSGLLAKLVTLPSLAYIVQQEKDADPLLIHAAREHTRLELAKVLNSEFNEVLERTESQGPYTIDGPAKGRRSLHATALAYLFTLGDAGTRSRCLKMVRDGNNMTDVLAALGLLSTSNSEEGETALEEFYDKWSGDNLVVLKWLGIQAAAPRADALDIVKSLIAHPAYDMTTPNKVYAVLGGFAGGNIYGLHSSGPESYDFLAEQIIKLDGVNPQVASRIARTLSGWRQYSPKIQKGMTAALQTIVEQENLSNDVYEIVSKSLA